ncbi:response regulator transcription factor [Sanguibacter suaedae]|uniref:Response regulator transcription factor n=1 Tax=Sanguibacter suaedae TaxID=2795737 RepID=A0A934I7J1_9MICO|nr:response regulator transcription factor [Sanguibacter suaedae]MBI9115666.1 response regulator transcription factor [Sanguibacter suaedae]
MTGPVRVLLVDDHALVRSGFAMVLSVEDDVEVVGQAANGREALDALSAHPADVVLMDVQMPVMDGIAATQEIVAQGLAKVIILTTFDRDDYLFDALAAGASGFLLKNADPDDLVEAVRAVAEGHALLAPEATLKVISRLVGTEAGVRGAGGPVPGGAPQGPDAQGANGAAGTGGGTTVAGSTGTAPPTDGAGPVPADLRQTVDTLSPREREVLGLLAEGLSNAEIAERLFLGESTVKTYVSNVLAKTASRDRVQAVVFAYRTGIVGTA